MSLTMRASSSMTVRSSVARPVSLPSVAHSTRSVVMRAETAAKGKGAVEAAIKEAETACADGSTQACAAAWDAVEEVSASVADKKAADKKLDPLEQFCEGDPSADECRVYDE